MKRFVTEKNYSIKKVRIEGHRFEYLICIIHNSTNSQSYLCNQIPRTTALGDLKLCEFSLMKTKIGPNDVA